MMALLYIKILSIIVPMKKKRTTCLYCGNNPVNHKIHFVLKLLDMFLSPTGKLNDLSQNKYMRKLLDLSIKPVEWTLALLHLYRFHNDIDRSVSDRSRVIWEEAQRRGIEMEGLEIFGRTPEQYRAKVNGKWHYFESLPIPPHFDTGSYSWMDDKGRLRSFLEKHKIPVATGVSTSSVDSALKIFDMAEPPFSIKPQLGSRGRHTTTHIYTKKEFAEAFRIAQQLCYFVIAEEHLIGSVYRGTYVNGEVVGILRGDPPRVTGDGKSTIKQLIEMKNKKKHPKVKDVVVTDHHLRFLKRQKLALSSILPKGKTIDLLEKIGISYGGFAVEDTDKTHPRIFKYIKKAGDALGAPIVGFDFIIEDITVDPATQRWGIIEANSLPFIDLHHFPLEGEPINVAAKVWGLWKK